MRPGGFRWYGGSGGLKGTGRRLFGNSGCGQAALTRAAGVCISAAARGGSPVAASSSAQHLRHRDRKLRPHRTQTFRRRGREGGSLYRLTRRAPWCLVSSGVPILSGRRILPALRETVMSAARFFTPTQVGVQNDNIGIPDTWVIGTASESVRREFEQRRAMFVAR